MVPDLQAGALGRPGPEMLPGAGGTERGQGTGGGGAGRVGCEAQGAGGLAPSSECLSEIPREEEEGFMGAEPSRQ